MKQKLSQPCLPTRFRVISLNPILIPEIADIKVLICNLAGEYLSDDGHGWSFAPNPDRALVFDYHADDVATQLRQVQRARGVVVVAVPLDPQLTCETCDICGTKMHSIDAHFDGARFLCSSCRTS